MSLAESFYRLLAIGLPLLLAVVVSGWTLARSQSGAAVEAPLLKPPSQGGSQIRRLVALLTLAFALFLGVFQPLSMIGQQVEIDTAALSGAQLFWLHAVLAGTLVAWYLLAFAGLGVDSRGARVLPRAQLGLTAARPWVEVQIGLLTGALSWATVLGLLMVIGAVLVATGAEGLLPQAAPPLITWIAGQSWILRLGVSLSAGVVEELFFRGFLQPRIGIAGSTALFALAHAGYEQPFLLLGVTALSVIFALLRRWRGNVLAAMMAHAVFDAVQLLVVIPMVLNQTL